MAHPLDISVYPLIIVCVGVCCDKSMHCRESMSMARPLRSGTRYPPTLNVVATALHDMHFDASIHTAHMRASLHGRLQENENDWDLAVARYVTLCWRLYAYAL